MHTGAEWEVQPIRAEDLEASCKAARKSAAGLDNWSPADFRLLSRTTFQWLAELLNQIEEGAPLPDEQMMAKAAFLVKSEDKQEDPLSYRVLLILPNLYRRWASTRLKHLEGWPGN